MNKNTNQLMLFKDFFHKKIEVDFNGGEVSSDAGWLFLREMESKIGIISKIANIIGDKRHPGYTRHSIFQLLTQRVFQISSGYEDANDCNELRNDPILKIACEKEESLASQPTMCRFENMPTRAVLYRIAQAFLEVFIASYAKPPEAIVIDMDETEDETYGHQQLSLFNSYYDSRCYLPMHIYEGRTGKLITTILRPGRRPSGKEIVTILKRIIKTIRKAWPKVGIIIRGDSCYSAPEVYNFCRENDLKFIFGFKAYDPVVKRSRNLLKVTKEYYHRYQEPVTRYGECYYQAQSWIKPNRIIYKVTCNREGTHSHFIVTNLEHADRKFIYEKIYSDRGNMELMIKEHKNHLHSDRTSCSRFQANQFRLFLHSIAYVLLHTLRERCLGNTEFAKAQFDTIRLKLLKIGARVRQLTTKIKIRLPTAYPYKEDIYKICTAITGFT
jgi:hypothetical protein